jgi:hypothetical protein
MRAKLDRRVVEGDDHRATFSQLLNEALEASRAAREVYRDAGYGKLGQPSLTQPKGDELHLSYQPIPYRAPFPKNF